MNTCNVSAPIPAGGDYHITRSATYVIAASDAPAHVKAQADKVCDGTDDYVQFQEVVDALAAQTFPGGKIKLSQGTFNMGAHGVVVGAVTYGFWLEGEDNIKTYIYGTTANEPTLTIGSGGECNHPTISRIRWEGKHKNPCILFTTNAATGKGANEWLVEHNEFHYWNTAIQVTPTDVSMSYCTINDNWFLGDTTINGGNLVKLDFAANELTHLWVYDNWFYCLALDNLQNAISIGSNPNTAPVRGIDRNTFFLKKGQAVYSYGAYRGTINDNKVLLTSTGTSASYSRVIYLNECTNASLQIDDNYVYSSTYGTSEAQYFVYFSHNPTRPVTIANNHIKGAVWQQANPIRVLSSDAYTNVKIRDNEGYIAPGEVRTASGSLVPTGTCTATTVTGTFTESPMSLKPGANTLHCTASGTLSVVIPTGSTAVVTSGDATVTDSPKSLAAGTTVVTVATGAGADDFTITVTPMAFTWHNPEAQDIYIKKVVIPRTAAGGTATSIIDVGIADDAIGTNAGIEFFDNLDANAAAAVHDSWVAGDGGTQTKWVLCQDSASATDGWIVGQIKTEIANSLAGSYYIEYVGK